MDDRRGWVREIPEVKVLANGTHGAMFACDSGKNVCRVTSYARPEPMKRGSASMNTSSRECPWVELPAASSFPDALSTPALDAHEDWGSISQPGQ